METLNLQMVIIGIPTLVFVFIVGWEVWAGVVDWLYRKAMPDYEGYLDGAAETNGRQEGIVFFVCAVVFLGWPAMWLGVIGYLGFWEVAEIFGFLGCGSIVTLMLFAFAAVVRGPLVIED
jgi:hypothetical protein